MAEFHGEFANSLGCDTKNTGKNILACLQQLDAKSIMAKSFMFDECEFLDFAIKIDR
jgi:hypothetical protein